MINLIKNIFNSENIIVCDNGFIEDELNLKFNQTLCFNKDKSQYYILYENEVETIEDIKEMERSIVPKNCIKREYYESTYDKNHTTIFLLKTKDIFNKELNEYILEVYRNLMSTIRFVILYNEEQEQRLIDLVNDTNIVETIRKYIRDEDNYFNFISKKDYLLYDICSKLFMSIPFLDLYESKEYNNFPLRLKKILRDNENIFDRGEICEGVVAQEGVCEDTLRLLSHIQQNNYNIVDIYEINKVPYKIECIFDKNGEDISYLDTEDKNSKIFSLGNKRLASYEYDIMHYIYTGKIFGIGLTIDAVNIRKILRYSSFVDIDKKLYVNTRVYYVLEFIRNVLLEQFGTDSNLIYMDFTFIKDDSYLTRIIEITRRINKTVLVVGLTEDISRYLRYKYVKVNKDVKPFYL